MSSSQDTYELHNSPVCSTLTGPIGARLTLFKPINHSGSSESSNVMFFRMSLISEESLSSDYSDYFTISVECILGGFVSLNYSDPKLML